MHLTFRYRLYPTRPQDLALHAQVDEACRLYNAALQERRDAWRMAHRAVRYGEQSGQLKAIRAEGDLGVANFSACQDVLRRADHTFAAFFRRVKTGQTAGSPRFKPRRRYASLTYPSYGNGCRLRATGRLYLQGIGELKVKLHRPVGGNIKTVSVKRESGKWYALFSCVCEREPLPVSHDSIGVDLGLTTFATLSDGRTIANPRHARAAARHLRLCQRRVARRQKGGHGRRMAVRSLQRAHAYLQHQRADFHHKAARDLVNRFGLIAVEDLNVKGLAGGRLAKSVADAGWASFLATLDDKAENAGRRVVRVNPSGTTQACSGCGGVVPKRLRQRWHACPACGLNLSRDENAARNIVTLGLSVAGETWPARASVPTEAVCSS